MAISVLSAPTALEARSASRALPEPRLVRAAHEFEAQMMKELLAPLNHQGALFADSDSDETGVMSEFASESLAGALSLHNGLGIANQIIHAVSHSGHSPVPAPVTTKSHVDNQMSPNKSLE